jgi:Cu(I)/Ag(I) efflux system membrane protein CusA/SilA
VPSAIVPIVTIPMSVALAFIPMKLFGLNANLMSLAGIAISIGVLVDGAIVEVENAYNKIQRWQAAGSPGDFHQVRLSALMEVGPSVFFSLLVIAVAFSRCSPWWTRRVGSSVRSPSPRTSRWPSPRCWR